MSKEEFYTEFAAGVRMKFTESSTQEHANRPGSIQDHANSIHHAACDLDDIIETLHAVNMDRLADKLSNIRKALTHSSGAIQELVVAWLQSEMRRNEATACGLLGVTMRVGDLTTTVSDINGEGDKQTHD